MVSLYNLFPTRPSCQRITYCCVSAVSGLFLYSAFLLCLYFTKSHTIILALFSMSKYFSVWHSHFSECIRKQLGVQYLAPGYLGLQIICTMLQINVKCKMTWKVKINPQICHAWRIKTNQNKLLWTGLNPSDTCSYCTCASSDLACVLLAPSISKPSQLALTSQNSNSKLDCFNIYSRMLPNSCSHLY